ncbi:hypothetical protein TNCV_3638091 [Trichonephila clavipes]|nr:hypothetical protein TNCV_3638091 [Trichonephila clavipes]
MRRPDELYGTSHCHPLKGNRANCTSEKANTGLKDIFPRSLSSHNASFKGMELCAVISNVMPTQTIKPPLTYWSISRTLEGR